MIASYRQNVHAYPSGGGDYEVVTTNLGPTAGLTVASALLVDYVLTVAVSMSSAMSNIGSAVPFINQHKVLFAVIAILILASINLRGIRESGTAFAIPTYAFMVGMYVMLGWGFFQIYVLGKPLQAESADFEMHSEHGEILGFALVFLVARAFSSGSAALTGVEAISNGVPAFRKPKSRNAATTLALLGGSPSRCSWASSCWPRQPARRSPSAHMSNWSAPRPTITRRPSSLSSPTRFSMTSRSGSI